MECVCERKRERERLTEREREVGGGGERGVEGGKKEWEREGEELETWIFRILYLQISLDTKF